MKFLQELHNLFEAEVAGVNHVELEDLVKHFPNNHKKAIEKLWGGPRLTYNGVPFFAEGSGEDILGQAEAAVKAWHADGGEVQVDYSNVSFEIDGQEYNVELSYKENIDPTEDGQEVYMGYDADQNALFQGYDVHYSEEVFNEEWDKAFEEETSMQFDYDDPQHSKAYHAAFEEFKHGSGFIIFELTHEGDGMKADDVASGDGLFYPEGHKWAKQQGLIDLRLD